MAKAKRRKAAKKITRKTGRIKRVKKQKLTYKLSGVTDALKGVTDHRAALLKQRAEIDSQIADIDQALAKLGFTAEAPTRKPAGRRPGPKPGRQAGKTRPGSLKEFVNNVLAGGGVMAVKDITTEVVRAGYKSKNKTLAKSVGIALTEMKNVKKVGRGRFRVK